MDRDALESRLSAFFGERAADRSVLIAYLYGSRARGTERAGSDVDVAVLLEGPDGARFPTQALCLEDELESWLGLPVQVVSLREAPVDLVHRILRDGRLVHEQDRSTRIAFEVKARNEYFDLIRLLRICRSRGA